MENVPSIVYIPCHRKLTSNVECDEKWNLIKIIFISEGLISAEIIMSGPQMLKVISEQIKNFSLIQ